MEVDVSSTCGGSIVFLFSTEGGKVNFLLFGHWVRELVGESSGWQWVEIVSGEGFLGR